MKLIENKDISLFLDGHTGDAWTHHSGMIMQLRQCTWLEGCVHGWGNGYVAIPEDHPYFGIESNDIDINGGLTCSNLQQVNGKKYWVLGFDTGHLGDTPYRWPRAEVYQETYELFEQLLKVYVKYIIKYKPDRTDEFLEDFI